MWSVTKSVSSMLIGQLVDAGSVSTSDTLEEIFGDKVKWDEVIEGESKKRITLEELLTMTSGLADPAALSDMDESNDPPQESLLDVLNHGTFTDSNEFSYLSSTHILAYVINSVSGETPAAFATDSSSGAFTALGIDTFTWTADAWHTTTNADGMQGSGYGLQMRVRDMAKIGQLYLQEGMSAPSTQLLSAEYVAASMAMKVGPWPAYSADNWMLSYCDDASNVRLEGYGYQWWSMATSADLKYTCAIGHGGQFICIYPTLDVVVAVTSDSTRDWTGAAGYRASCLVLAQIPDLFKNSTGTEDESTVAENIETGRAVFVIVIIVIVAASSFFFCILPLIILACFCCKKKRATPQPPHPAAAVSMATLPVATSASSVMPVATPVATMPVATAVAVPVAATGGAVATATAVA